MDKLYTYIFWNLWSTTNDFVYIRVNEMQTNFIIYVFLIEFILKEIYLNIVLSFIILLEVYLFNVVLGKSTTMYNEEKLKNKIWRKITKITITNDKDD